MSGIPLHQRVLGYIFHGTSDTDRLKCIRDGHEWETVGTTTLTVPEGEEDSFKHLNESDEFAVQTGKPLPDGQHSWAPIETSNQQCTRCGEVRTHSTP